MHAEGAEAAGTFPAAGLLPHPGVRDMTPECLLRRLTWSIRITDRRRIEAEALTVAPQVTCAVPSHGVYGGVERCASRPQIAGPAFPEAHNGSVTAALTLSLLIPGAATYLIRAFTPPRILLHMHV